MSHQSMRQCYEVAGANPEGMDPTQMPNVRFTHALLLGGREVATVRAPGTATIAEVRAMASTVTALTIGCDRPYQTLGDLLALINAATDHVIYKPGKGGSVHVNY